MRNGLFIVFLFTTCNILATDYYISSSNGNDNNDGLTPNNAWKTLDMLYYNIAYPGDTFHLKRGDVWYNQTLRIRYSGTEDNPITYTHYGTGSLPEISGVGTLPNTANWTNEGNNIWSITIDDTIVPDWEYYYYQMKRLYINGIEVLGAAEEQPDEIGTNIPDLVRFLYNRDSQLLLLYSTTNPNTLNIEFAFKQYALYFAWWATASNIIEYINIENLKFSGGNVACGSIKKSNHINLTNLDFGEKGNHGININANSHHLIIDNCLIDNRYYFDYSEAGIGYGKSNRGPREGFYAGWSNHIEFKNSTINNYTHANINLHGSYDENCEYYNIHHNYSTFSNAYGGRTVFESGTHNVEYHNNIIDGSSVQNQFSGQNNHIHHNIIKNIRSSPLIHYHSGWGISVYPYANTENITGNIFENNLIMNCESGGISIRNNSISITTNNIFRNNILINNGKFISHFTNYIQNQTSNIDLAIKISEAYDWDLHEFIEPRTSNNMFQNNLIYVDGNQPNSDNEAKIIYHLDNDDPNGWYADTISTIEFNTKNGINNDGINDNIDANPMFIDYIGGNYHLQSTSPCINTGKTPLATIDFEGNPVPYFETLPDIGIYEYQSTVLITESIIGNYLTAYPNPSNSFIFISDKYLGSYYQVTSITGNIVKKGKIDSDKINISNIDSGVYFLKLDIENTVIKLIKTD